MEADERQTMSDRIPVRLVESTPAVQTFEPSRPKMKAKSNDNLIHTRSFTGLFRTLRLCGAGFLFLLFFGTVWLNWGDRQAVLWDLSESKFHIFGATFWPQDFILLSALLIIAAFGLFAITVFAGRVWCGYTCPQSSWTWIFMWCEKITEGERNQRIKLQAAPWGLNKLLRRSAKHSLWLAISLLTGLTFVGYFTLIRPVGREELLTWQMGGVSLFWVLFFTGATYINAGWLREAVCMHMCPYARFQSVMFDKDTLTISYDALPVAEHRIACVNVVKPAEVGLGDCIDCQLCVQVRPTGIDIHQTACKWNVYWLRRVASDAAATRSWTRWAMPVGWLDPLHLRASIYRVERLSPAAATVNGLHGGAGGDDRRPRPRAGGAAHGVAGREQGPWPVPVKTVREQDRKHLQPLRSSTKPNYVRIIV